MPRRRKETSVLATWYDISVPQGNLGGVVQYDFGKRLSDGRFQQTSQLNAPPEVPLGVIPEIRRLREVIAHYGHHRIRQLGHEKCEGKGPICSRSRTECLVL